MKPNGNDDALGFIQVVVASALHRLRVKGLGLNIRRLVEMVMSEASRKFSR